MLSSISWQQYFTVMVVVVVVYYVVLWLAFKSLRRSKERQ
jgi:di/tricarboxylate transporter